MSVTYDERFSEPLTVPMRIAYLDCFSGISGDMFLGALLDAGVPFALLQKTVAALDVGATLELSRVDRGGISATEARCHRQRREGHAAGGVLGSSNIRAWSRSDTSTAHGSCRWHEPATLASHAADMPQEPRFGATQRSRWQTQSERYSAHHRDAPISERAKQTASEIFLALGAAEAKVHNVDVEHIHFHEVGAADAIVDIVCAAVGAEALGVDQFVASPLNVGGGTVACAHGVMPVPAPATLELLKGAPIYSGEIQKELVTPTGAAIVKVLVSSFGPRPR